ncbi:mechanosensitive ion channel [bacterium]|nr:mechanosensitive ion channel [bacterium]
MNQYAPLIIELGIMAAVWLLGAGFASVFHRKSRTEHGSRGRPRNLGTLLAYLTLPVFVLVLSFGAERAAGLFPQAAAWLDGHGNHVSAWLLFWLGVGLILLVEGILHLVYASRGRNFPVPDLLLDILRLLLILALAFGVLSIELGLNIGPLLASTALITAVVGFALQGVLGNLLAGMSLHISRSMVPGDWIDLGETMGKVVETNWRETRVRTNDGHMIIVPNSKVADAVIHNMVRPNSTRRHQVNVGASYADAPDAVIAALVEAALEVPEVLRNPPPDAFVTAYQDYGINYVLRFWSKEYHRRLVIEGHVNRMIWYKFKRRGIEIPFPMSDKLLYDFMEVVQTQGRKPAPAAELSRITELLAGSDLVRTLVTDLQGAPLLTREHLGELAPHVRRVLYTRGETLCRQGDPGDSCFLVVSGQLSGRVRNDQGQEIAAFDLGPGALVGEMSLMLGVPRSAEITLPEGAELIEIGPEAFKVLLGLHPEVPESLARLAEDRAKANRAALEAWAGAQSGNEGIELNAKGFLHRFLKILGH